MSQQRLEKKGIRVLGLDDAPFKFSDDRTEVVGVVVRIPSYIEGVIVSAVGVDGEDATDALIDMVSRSRFREQLRLIMVDGIALGGFNIVDIERLWKALEIPVVTVTRDRPDFEAMKEALKHHFSDWEDRIDSLAGEVTEIPTQHKPIHVRYAGIELEVLKEIIELSTVRGALPEPIRVAHLIASAVKRGESYGRA